MVKNYPQEIYEFILHRDGKDTALEYIKRYQSTYFQTAMVRKKFGKSDNFRKIYVQTAWDFRKFLRNL